MGEAAEQKRFIDRVEVPLCGALSTCPPYMCLCGPLFRIYNSLCVPCNEVRGAAEIDSGMCC